MKLCSCCRIPLDDANAKRVNVGKQAGEFRAYCKPCSKLAAREYRRNNREKMHAAARIYRNNNRVELRRRAREAGQNRRFSELGITREYFLKMLSEQSGRCKICQTSIWDKKACLDHDHKTGRVRGVLCGLCNSGLGCFKDSPERLTRAAAYLTCT